MGGLRIVDIGLTRSVPARIATREIPGQQLCAFCHGSGTCGKCGGSGHRLVRVKHGWFRRRVGVTCMACVATGKCGLCRGEGIVKTPLP